MPIHAPTWRRESTSARALFALGRVLDHTTGGERLERLR